MKRHFLAAVVAASLTWAAAAQDHGPVDRSIPIDGVAAFVNDRSITISDVLTAMQSAQARLAETFEGEELKKRLREAYEDAMRTMIERELILGAYKDEKMQLPEWVVDNRISEIIGEQFGGDRSTLNEALQKDRMTYQEWREDVRDHLIVQYMRNGHVDRVVNVAPSDVRAAYDRQPEQYGEPAQVKLGMIVLKVDGTEGPAVKREVAEAMRRRALAGEDFGALAREASDGAKAQDGGDWDWMEPSLLRREIVDALDAMAPGEISPVIETPDELYLVKLNDRRPTSVAPFDEVRPDIERALRREKSDAVYKDWVGRLWDAAYIKVVVEDPF
jgi:parvulin-like peptidyl-prolyl isomerase